MIPMHAQAVAGDPRTLRWVVPPGTLPALGEVDDVPGPLGELLTDGTLCAISVEPDGVYTTLTGPGWAAVGPQVRSALQVSLGQAGEWRARAGNGSDQDPLGDGIPSDARIAAAARDVIAGAAGDYLRSHGGSAEITAVSEGVVRVRLRGACAGCPAAATTLQAHLAEALRREVPGVREVVQVGGGPITRRLSALRRGRSDSR